MAGRLAATLLVALLCGAATAANMHSLTWDRFWLRDNLEAHTLTVSLGDTIKLLCRVDAEQELEMDVFENVVLLDNEQQLINCDSGTNPIRFLGGCTVTGFDFTVPVIDSLLATQPSFVAGEVYYFTSFSNGSLYGAQNQVTNGGGCGRSPPLILTVSVSATASSSVAPTSTVSTTSTKSSTVVIKMTSTPVIALPTAPPVIGDSRDNGAGHFVSLNFIVLLVLATLASCFIL